MCTLSHVTATQQYYIHYVRYFYIAFILFPPSYYYYYYYTVVVGLTGARSVDRARGRVLYTCTLLSTLNITPRYNAHTCARTHIAHIYVRTCTYAQWVRPGRRVRIKQGMQDKITIMEKIQKEKQFRVEK